MTRSHTMAAKVAAYLSYRRSLGFQLRHEGGLLQHFAKFADDAKHRGPLTTALALRWARDVTSTDPLYWARRLEVVRCFARFLAVTEPAAEIPARGLLGPAHRRTQPYIFAEAEITHLMVAAGQLAPHGGLRPHTYQTLIGLLAACGLRISEALHLTCPDVDLQCGQLTIRETKFRKTRLVPLHATTTGALRAYATRRDQTCPLGVGKHFFVNERGAGLPYSTVRTVFRQLCEGLGITRRGRRPRLHDLRHTFACRRVEAWYASKTALAQAVVALSVYLGHAKVTDTYWYLTATPELLARAAARFERFSPPVATEGQP